MTSASFLQSKEWEVFQKNIGRKTWRIENALVILHKLPLGLSYLYCPRPGHISSSFAEKVKKDTSINAIFLKIDPIEELSIQHSAFSIQHSNGLQPQKTVILDFQKTEDELFHSMHEKTRYNIRIAERKGVHITDYGLRITDHDLQVFWRLLKETAERNNFHTHEQNYYGALCKTQSADFSNELFIAEFKGIPVAAALINFYGPSKTATYLHGASSGDNRDVMAPHLLHWEIIKEAKRRGFLQYDFWGIDERKWHGVTRFKKRFGGEVVAYPASVDFIYRPFWYYVYKGVRKLW